MRYISLLVLALLCSVSSAQDYFVKSKPATLPDVDLSGVVSYGAGFFSRREAKRGKPATPVLRVTSSAAKDERILLTVLGAPWCQYCGKYDSTLESGLARGRLQVHKVDIDPQNTHEVDPEIIRHVVAEYGPLPDLVLPLTLFKNAKGETYYIQGNVTLPVLLAKLNKYHAATVDVSNTAAYGVGGSIHGREMIREGLQQWRTYVGLNNKIKLRWDRSGLQKMELLNRESWALPDVCGKMGHFIICGKVPKVPIESIGFGYRLNDNRPGWSIDPDPFDLVIPETQPQPGEAAYGIDPLTLGASLYSLGTILYQVINPEVDLLLGGCVEVTIVMIDDELVFTFSECPGIRVKAWLEWQLEVEELRVKETNVHVGIKPQPRNWFKIKSRDFPVEE